MRFDTMSVFIPFLDDGISTEGLWEKWLLPSSQAERHRILERTNEAALKLSPMVSSLWEYKMNTLDTSLMVEPT